jgi:hypothetical protein
MCVGALGVGDHRQGGKNPLEFPMHRLRSIIRLCWSPTWRCSSTATAGNAVLSDDIGESFESQLL